MKQRKPHSYHLPDSFVAAMLEHRQTAELLHPRWVFPGLSGDRPRADLSSAHERIETRAGIEHVKGRRVHCFRHAAITDVAEAGASATDIQAFAGHADIQTSMKYIHARRENQRLRGIVEARAKALATS